MIRAVIFDLDNTLIDFMAMKRLAIEGAINAMIDAGLKLTREEIQVRIDTIYKERGIEFQKHGCVWRTLICTIFSITL